MGSFSSYQIARSGLNVSERALNVTGHNIANVNTTGYVRQQAIMETSPYRTISVGLNSMQVGLGVDIQQTRQIRHIFLDNMYRRESTTLGYWKARSETLQDIESILAEPFGEGFQSIINEFWDSWQELSKEPQSLTARALVRQRSESLISHVNHIGEQLNTLQRNINLQIKDCISQVNDITAQIAKLNTEIAKQEVTGDSANDYRDQRNLLVDKLCSLVDVDVTEMPDGQLAITLGGYYIVNRDKTTNLSEARSDDDTRILVPVFEGTDEVVPAKNGMIKGLMDSNDVIDEVRNRINYLINTIATEVNKLHKSGKTLDVPPQDGSDFFVPENPAIPIEMGNFALNPIFYDNDGLNKLVTSVEGDSGDNTIALQIANIRHAEIMYDGSNILSIDGYYQNFILDIGNYGAEASRIYENQQKLVESADANRQAISGVAMDEEMANMMKYKFSYDASSRVLNIIDDMIETVILRMGLVGR